MKTNLQCYGIAASYYLGRFNCCVMLKKNLEADVEKIENKDLSFSVTNRDEVFNATDKFLGSIKQAVLLQKKANEQFGNDSYVMPVGIAWPGMEGWKDQIEIASLNDLKQAVSGREYKDGEVFITNLLWKIYDENNNTARINPMRGILRRLEIDTFRSEVFERQAQELKPLFEKANKGDAVALQALCEKAKFIAGLRALSSLSRRADTRFFMFDAPHHVYLNLPKVREVLKSTLEEILKKKVSVKFPGDGKSDHFFNVVMPMMEDQALKLLT